MPTAKWISGTVWEDTGPYLMARVKGNDGANIMQSDVSSITYDVIDAKDPSTKIVDGSSLTISSVIFDTLQTDARWTADSTGYNFGFALDDSLLSGGGTIYKVIATLTMQSGGDIVVGWKITTIKKFDA